MAKPREAGHERFRRVGRSIWAAVGPLLLICVFALVVRARDVSKARVSYEQRLFVESGRLLRPWFRLGLLGAGESKILMSSLLASYHDPDTALEAADHCLRASQDAECALGVALAYERLERPDQARDVLLIILGQAPGMAMAHLALGRLAEKAGQSKLAQAEYGSAAANSEEKGKERERMDSLLALVKFLNKQKRFDEAKQYLSALQSLSDRSSLEGLYAIAETQLGLKDDRGFAQTMSLAEGLRGQSRVGTYYVLGHPDLYLKFDELGHKN